MTFAGLFSLEEREAKSYEVMYIILSFAARVKENYLKGGIGTGFVAAGLCEV